MKINDIKENFALPNISYDKYGMPDYSPYLEIITKAFKDKDLGKVQIQRFLEDKLGIRARLARELIQRWEKVNREKILECYIQVQAYKRFAQKKAPKKGALRCSV